MPCMTEKSNGNPLGFWSYPALLRLRISEHFLKDKLMFSFLFFHSLLLPNEPMTDKNAMLLQSAISNAA